MLFVCAEATVILTECLIPTVRVTVGEDVTLPCLAHGNPTLTWVWTRADQILRSSERISFLDMGSRLVLSSVEESDAGLYTCNVSNIIEDEVFFDTTTIRLDVQSKTYLCGCVCARMCH